MKKLLHSFLICMGIMMISSQTFAQNNPGEKLQPYVGGTYTYTFDGITDGLTYEFYMSTSSTSNNGKGSAATTLDGYITSSLTGTVAGGKAEATITWPSTAVTDTEVYLFVKIDGSGVCENYNAVGITPIDNNITLALGDDIKSPSCPDLDGLVSLVAPTNSYNPGSTTLTYTFTKTGNDNAWNLKFNITQVGTGAYSYTINGATIKVPTASSTTTVDLKGLTDNEQTLTIVVKNVPGDSPSFKITPVTVTDDVTFITIPNPIAVTHVITPMPVIGGFH